MSTLLTLLGTSGIASPRPGAPGGHLAASWAPLGVSPGPLLGCSGRRLDLSGAFWGASGSAFGHVDVSWSAFGVLLGGPLGYLGGRSGVFFWGALGVPGAAIWNDFRGPGRRWKRELTY